MSDQERPGSSKEHTDLGSNSKGSEERAEQDVTAGSHATVLPASSDDASSEYTSESGSDDNAVSSNASSSEPVVQGGRRKFSFEVGPDGLSMPSSAAPPVLSRNDPYEGLPRPPFGFAGRDALASDGLSIHSLDISRPQTPLRRRGAVRRTRTASSRMGGATEPDDDRAPREYTSFPFPEPFLPESPAVEELRSAWLGLQNRDRMNSSPLSRPGTSNDSINSK
ncbi:uncharacterized protein F4812DRAFT_458651 [Daldinia caldariorum]|uniref:uncharacterized protein n=1 Tax=Daldinia caldariorum TaxID=326644 RepID=UPI0020074887|nr:uncharacterized protein F4812DRAFT_458651 [Daldinia caldariorum]KAI1468219.1 hypothetical protein F4812DRAFT_458651 [Daldinia caldariorum]